MWYDDDRESMGCRCSACGKMFRTLADEVGMHECPRCGYTPYHDEPDDAEEDDDAPNEIGP